MMTTVALPSRSSPLKTKQSRTAYGASHEEGGLNLLWSLGAGAFGARY